jgi:type II secretory pathway pseudopilin PulG
MNMKLTKTRGRGWIVFEMTVALGVLAVLLSGMAMFTRSTRQFNQVQAARRQCTAAAMAQLESLTARGEGMDAATLQRLWPGVETNLRREPGQEHWQGLTLVTVEATCEAGERPVSVELSRYVREGGLQ